MMEKNVILKHAEIYMEIAHLWAKNSHCERAKVGCIIVKDQTIISDGYNGMPTGFDNCCETNGKTNPYVLHAEANALAKLLRSGHSSTGSSLFTTLSPCIECAKLILQAQITELYYAEAYHDTSGLDLLSQYIKIHKI